MSLGNNYFDEWLLVSFRPKTLRRIVEQDGVQRLERTSLWTIIQRRNGYNITTFNDATGTKSGSFSVETGPTSGFTKIYTGKAFVCDDDSLDVVDESIGHYIQTQVWVWQSPWETTPDDEFDEEEAPPP